MEDLLYTHLSQKNHNDSGVVHNLFFVEPPVPRNRSESLDRFLPSIPLHRPYLRALAVLDDPYDLFGRNELPQSVTSENDHPIIIGQRPFEHIGRRHDTYPSPLSPNRTHAVRDGVSERPRHRQSRNILVFQPNALGTRVSVVVTQCEHAGRPSPRCASSPRGDSACGPA